MCQYNCMSRWQTHVSLSIQHILCNIQYTIYIYIIYIYICIYTSTYSNSRQYVRELVNTCARQCFITLSAKKWVHRFARYKKSRPQHVKCRCTWLDLTCFYPWARNGKNHPQMVVGPMALGESTSGHWKLLVHGKRTTSELVVLGPSGSLTAKKMGKMVV